MSQINAPAILFQLLDDFSIIVPDLGGSTRCCETSHLRAYAQIWAFRACRFDDDLVFDCGSSYSTSLLFSCDHRGQYHGVPPIPSMAFGDSYRRRVRIEQIRGPGAAVVGRKLKSR